MTARILLVTSALFLTASATAQRGPVTIPIHQFKSGHIGVQVRVNGKGPYRLVLDTGSPVTFFSSRAAKAAGIPVSSGAAMPGMFGMGINPFAKARSIDVGGAVVKDLDIMVLDHPVIEMLGTVEGPVDGIVGFTFFSRFRTTLDYGAKRVTFAPSSYQPADVIKNVFKILMDRNGARRVVAPAALWGLSLEDSAAGPLVKEVFEGGPAAASGVRPGDRIESVGGRWVESTLGFFERAAAIRPDTDVPVVVRREGKPVTLRIRPVLGM